MFHKLSGNMLQTCSEQEAPHAANASISFSVEVVSVFPGMGVCRAVTVGSINSTRTVNVTVPVHPLGKKVGRNMLGRPVLFLIHSRDG